MIWGKTHYFWKPSNVANGASYSSDRYVLVLPNGNTFRKKIHLLKEESEGDLKTGVLERQVSYFLGNFTPKNQQLLP